MQKYFWRRAEIFNWLPQIFLSRCCSIHTRNDDDNDDDDDDTDHENDNDDDGDDDDADEDDGNDV